MKKIMNIGNNGIKYHKDSCEFTIIFKFKDPDKKITETIVSPIDTS